MSRRWLAVGLVLLGLVTAPGLGAPSPEAPSESSRNAPTAEPLAPEPEPVPVEKVETEHVRLLMLDVVVLDREGRSVPDLGAEEFEVVADGRAVAVDTLDLDCPHGALEDVRAVNSAKARISQPVPGSGRRLVLALDYEHLGQLRRAEVLEQARAMIVNQEIVDGEELMLVALNGGLRVEQAFTGDREQVLRVLKRMEYDISLWAPSFSHGSEAGFVSGLTALFDVLGTYPGHKAVVLFSEMRDVPLDSQFRAIAAHAAAARCSIYPIDAMGLRTLEQDRALLTGG